MDPPGRQQELPLPFPEFSGDLPLLPVRMVNEYMYCPRLAYLEWVQAEWAESGDTVEGRYSHRRVDQPQGDLPPPGAGSEETIHARSITLSSNSLGLIAKLDLVEGEGDIVTPVDYKRGKRPHVPRGAYDPERVQLCAQGLILRDHGYRCDEGVLYFAASRERVRVSFDDELIRLTENAISGLRLVAAGGQLPPPLVDSPKCPRCSLNGICLPDEINFFKGADLAPRPLFVAHDEALPVYVQAHHAKVSKKGETLEIHVDDKKVTTARLIHVSQLALSGNVYLTTPTLHELMKRGIPVTWQSFGGWFMGHTVGTGHKNVELRTAQYRASFDDQICLHLAKGLVEAKIRNSRTLLRRNWKSDEDKSILISSLQRDVRHCIRCHGIEELLGVEGAAASRYFSAFGHLLRPADNETLSFNFTRRNRRPPTDPVNALLSYAYSLLARLWTVTLSAVGFDPYRGFYHQPRYGRPALALDLMEPFRPLIADSCVLQAINNGEVRPSDFIQVAGSVNLNSDGRKRFIGAFERRLGHEITHPLLGYRISYRRLIELQSRLLGRFLLGDLPDYPNFITR
ncbi:MAG: CRISPR-associated endonuclease Cas1 [Gammaproteobacteria bacterium]|nr:CRISPR-associated endonuclease Cas1 [Gammaproteobacteria bacterium]